MALELQISTSQANQALAQVERSLESLRASLDRLGNTGTNLNGLVTQLRELRVDQAQVSAVSGLASALSGLNRIKDIDSLATGMSKLANLNFTTIAANVERFGIALAQIKLPPGLGQIATAFNTLGRAARDAETHVKSLKNATDQAGGGMNNLRGAIAPVTNLLSAFGVALGAAGFANFIRSAYDATSAFQSFQAQMSNLYGGSNVAAQTQFTAEQFRFLRQVARETGRDIQDLMPAYSRWAQNTVRSGMSARDAATDFYRLNVVFRVFGLNADQATGAMRAFEQMVSKGKIQMEELRGQLGDRGIPAVAAMAQALGVGTDKLAEMMAAGTLTSREVTKLVNVLYEMASPGLPAAMRTLDATMNLFKNTITELNLAFGTSFFSAFAGGFKVLEEALASPRVLQAMESIGSFLGQFASGFSVAIAVVVSFGAEVVNVITSVIGVISEVATAIFSWIPGFDQLAASGISIGNAIGFAAGILMAFVAAGALVWTVNVALRAVALTIGALNLLTSSWRVAILGIVIAIAGVSYVMARFRGDAEGAASATGMVNTMLGALTGTAPDTAAALSDTANEYANVSGAAGNTTRRTNEQTEATRRAALESRNMNAAMRNETAERRRLDQALRDLTGSHNSAGGSADTHTGALGRLSGAMGGATGSGNGLNNTLGGNISSFNAAAGAARSYGDALSWVNNVGDRVPVLSRGPTPRGAPRNVQDELRNQGSYSNYTRPSDQPTLGVNPDGSFYELKATDTGGYTRNYDVIDSNQDYTPSYTLDSNKVDQSVVYDQSSDYEYMQRGGLIGHAIDSRRAPASLWVGAPKYADGGYTPSSGEVPIIAHQGEAVVPLPDGRSIPVSFTGGEFIDSIRAIGVVFKNESDRWIQALEQQTLVLDVIANKISIISSSATPSTPSQPVPQTLDPTDAKTSTSNNKHAGLFGGSGSWELVNGTVTWTGQNGGWNMSGGSAFGVGDKGIPKFAAGTPNTSLGTGISAIVHPNEAIIPLPDGRRVPVELREPADKYSPLRRATEPGTRTPTTTQASRTGPVTVNMYINTPDAKSFQSSQDQMLTDLQTKIERARSRIGFGGSVDDPTVRKV